MGHLFPPLPAEALVFVPSEPEFLRLAEEILGPVEPELEEAEKEEQQTLNELRATSQQLLVLGQEMDSIAEPAPGDGGAPGATLREELIAELNAGEGDLQQLMQIAGIPDDERQPPPPENPQPEPPPDVPPPPPGGDGPPEQGPPGPNPQLCRVFRWRDPFTGELHETVVCPMAPE